MKIWAHSLVKNEARWLWFSVTSVIDYVDRVLLWDSGSTDGSLEIEKELVKRYPDKISLKERKISTPEEFPLVRMEMLEATDADWFMVLDGDEVWWRDSIEKVVTSISDDKDNLESVVVPVIYPVGDIFHRLEESAGHYQLLGRKGHYGIKFINRTIPGLSSSKPHGTWGWTDAEGKMIQDRDASNIKYIDAPYLHLSFLPRAGMHEGDLNVMKRKQKLKYEIGSSFPRDYYYPEALFKDRPEFVPSPWEGPTSVFKLRAAIETPLRKIKRRMFKMSVGY